MCNCNANGMSENCICLPLALRDEDTVTVTLAPKSKKLSKKPRKLKANPAQPSAAEEPRGTVIYVDFIRRCRLAS